MIPIPILIVTKESAEEVEVGSSWTCVEISGVAVDAGDVELIRVDFAANMAWVRYKGVMAAGPMMIRTDHPNYMGQEVAVLFV
jgi:hypothetical protein